MVYHHKSNNKETNRQLKLQKIYYYFNKTFYEANQRICWFFYSPDKYFIKYYIKTR